MKPKANEWFDVLLSGGRALHMLAPQRSRDRLELCTYDRRNALLEFLNGFESRCSIVDQLWRAWGLSPHPAL
jgi:hypothetical protein